jgi:hypothetical protein
MQRPGDEMGPFAAIAGAETAPTRKFGRHVFDIAALLRVSDILCNYRVWVVEMVWFELAAPHTVLSNRVSIRTRLAGESRYAHGNHAVAA